MEYESKIIAISDLEGFDIYSTIPKKCHNCHYLDCNECSKTRIYICGDLIDSTSSGYLKIDKDKIFNLHNIFIILKSPKIELILGNRDINKIKCCILNKLNGRDKLIDNYNIGNMDLNYNMYNKLKTILEKKNVWYAPIKNWYTF